ncbi:Gfo/Idh/MocA family protein [Paenibacillus pinistramenti]|uniref:Gfo/Idh/MocA family protein n=1 Tax=Paenibacillus pinistramenti TaxID=1768003 RepID=UPI0011085987|nr:Gfo/Idh/MocA family oxidoreductase [Paenibacillus pinistramenti]
MTAGQHGISIIGYGGMGSQHARLLTGLGANLVSGIWDIDRNKRTAAEAAGLNVYSSFMEALNDPLADLVLIATPNHLHKEMAIQAMQAGKHVICEKPVTLNSRELEEILEAAGQYGRLFVVHQNRRWDEDYLTIKKIYDERLLGEVFHLETRVQGSRGIPGDWRKEPEFGGGMMLDWGVHLIDRLLLMIGERVKQVYCTCTYVTGEQVDDGFRLLLTFESGKTALVEVGTSHFITLPKWYMCGNAGTAVIEDWEMNGRLVRLRTREGNDAKPIAAGAGLTKTMAPRNDETIEELELPAVKASILDFYRNVFDTLEGKAEILVKNSEVLRVMKVMEAAFESDRVRQAVPFE